MRTAVKVRDAVTDVAVRRRIPSPVAKSPTPVKRWIGQMQRVGDAVRALVEQQPDLRSAGAHPSPTATALEAVGTQMRAGFPRQDLDLMWAVAEGDDDVMKWDQTVWHWVLTGRRLMTAIDENLGPVPMESPTAWMQKAQELHTLIFVETKYAEPGVWRTWSHPEGLQTTREENQATMLAGYELIMPETEPLVRSAMGEFLVTIVNPFGKGSGRLARLLANRETKLRRIPMQGPWYQSANQISEYSHSLCDIEWGGAGHGWAANLMNWQRASGYANGHTVLETMRKWAGQLWSYAAASSDEYLQEYRARQRELMTLGPGGRYGDNWPEKIMEMINSKNAGES